MSPPAAETGRVSPGEPPRRAGSTRRDPYVLLAIALLLLVLRIGFVIREARQRARAGDGASEVVDRVAWRPLNVGLAESRATGRPLLLDFTADWCPPCRLMQSEIFADPGTAAELNRRFVPVRVLDRAREDGRNAPWVDSLQARFRVGAFPTLVITRPDGEAPVRIEGYLGRDFTLGRIEDARLHLRVQDMVPPAGARQ